MITVREMLEKDAKEAGRLEKENFSEPWSANAFLETLKLDYAYYCVAEEDGRLVGICGLRNIAGEGEITNVAVDKAYRRRNTASMLLEHILDIGKKKGVTAFTLEVREGNEPAVNLYKKFGFLCEGIRRDFYDNPKEDALIMWKR